MCASSVHGNRETPVVPGGVPPSGRAGKVGDRTPVAHATGESDGDMVPERRMNKDVSPPRTRDASAESEEGRSPAKGNSGGATALGTQGPPSASSGLSRVREAARRDRSMRFTNLLHHIDVSLLRAAYGSLRRKASAGVDGVTWEEYGCGLDERLADLHERLHRGSYRAQPSKRVWIPKGDGSRRPLGLATVEDKVVQQALVWVLQEIYEVDFLGFSYGFRPGRSPHQALDALYVAITQRKVSWVLDADIRSFYDRLDHGWLMKMLRHRIADRRVLRLIRKFLRAGVSEDGEWSRTVVGTPQGAVISPLLANIYLHYALDLWVKQWRRRHARGEVYIVRYADDFALGFQHWADATQFLADLRERMQRFGLELHEDKSRLIEFGRFAAGNRAERGEGKPETFDFLGFTHICAKRRKDHGFKLLRRTARKRMRKKLGEVRRELMRRRHRPVPEQAQWLRSVLQGFFNYFAVPGNRASLDVMRTQCSRAWLWALRRRSQKARRLTWARLSGLIARWLPKARVLHPYPNVRFCVTPKAGAV